MRVVPCLALLACCCLGPAGCTSFGKRSGSAGTPTSAGKAQARAAADSSDPLVRHATTQELSGLLAGRVIDTTTSRPVEAYVQWECLDDAKGSAAAPIDVAARDGYFTIQGLQPGRHYKLTARAKQGDHLLAGISFVTAPNIHVLIKMSEDFVNKGTPPLPGPPNPNDKQPEASRDLKKTGGTWGPGVGAISIPQPAEPSPQARPPAPQQGWNQPPAQPSYPPGIARQEQQARAANDPLVNIGDPAQQRPMQPSPAMPQEPATAPSCSLVGRRLYNLALKDASGQTWEWRTNRRGKLVLIDFWFTSCGPCLEAIDHMKALQAQYGPMGLEVLGIACESQGTPQEQAYRVALKCQSKQTNYRILLGDGQQGLVAGQFRVHFYPSLFLLDENGDIVWSHEGGFRPPAANSGQESADLRVLRREIETRLGVQRTY